MSPNFAVRWCEIDPAWQVVRVLGLVGLIALPKEPQFGRLRQELEPSVSAAE